MLHAEIAGVDASDKQENGMLFDGGYTYSNFLMNMISIFVFVVWFWLLIVI